MDQKLLLQQKQILMLQLRQSLNILSMNAEQLHEYVKNAAESNPLLEFDPVFSNAEDSFDHAELIPDNRPDPGDSLKLQINIMDALPAVRKIALVLLSCLDGNGYLRIPTDELSSWMHASANLIEQAIALLQKCEPRGVGARNLEECLLLQVPGNGRVEQCARLIIRRQLEQLAQNTSVSVPGFTASETEKAILLIRSLSPAPYSSQSRESVFVIPDVKIEIIDGQIEVSLINQQDSVHISSSYHDYKAAADPETRAYLRTCIDEARHLISYIGMRNATLLTVVKAICSEQRDYFLTGCPPVHLTLQRIASTVGLNTSTVCRTVRDKYCLFSGRVFPLSAFFPSATKQGLSSAALKKEIKMLVASESGCHPLNDQEISDMLLAKGIAVPRRTIAKYRNELRIAPASKRRKKGS